MSRLGKYYLQVKHLSNWGPSLHKLIVFSTERDLPLCLPSSPEIFELRIMPYSLIASIWAALFASMSLLKLGSPSTAASLPPPYDSPRLDVTLPLAPSPPSPPSTSVHSHLQVSAYAICPYNSSTCLSTWPSFKEGESTSSKKLSPVLLLPFP